MTIYICDNATGQFFRVIHDLSEYRDFEEAQGRHFVLEPNINGTFNVWVNRGELNE